MTELAQTFGFWLEVAGIAGGLISATAAVVTWWFAHTLVSRRDFSAWREDHERDHEKLDRRLDDGQRRFATVDGELKHRPGMTDLGQLQASIVALEVEVARLAENRAHVGERVTELSNSVSRRLDSVEEKVERVIDFLMKKGAPE